MSSESGQILERDRPPRWRAAFLGALRTTGMVSAACRLAGVGRRTVYDHREADPEFAKAWDEALDESADLLVLEARRRAYDGTDEPVVWQGSLSGVWVDPNGTVVSADTPGAKLVPLTVKKYSDALLMFLIKARRPEYRDSFRVQHAGDAQQPVKVEHSGQVGQAGPDWSLLTDEELEQLDGLYRRLAERSADRGRAGPLPAAGDGGGAASPAPPG